MGYLLDLLVYDDRINQKNQCKHDAAQLEKEIEGRGTRKKSDEG
jgi:hypothetical protein